MTPIDSTALLFSALSGEKWATTDLYYPQLKSFVGTDASLLSVAPMYINTEVVEPVNHANDLTEDFTVTTLGGIAWACEDVNDEEWIKISGSNIKVVRPCTETDVLTISPTIMVSTANVETKTANADRIQTVLRTDRPNMFFPLNTKL